MKSHTITNEEIEALKVASLPNRPTAPEEYGGHGFTAKEMKAAFDRLPLYLVERFNDLVDDIETESSDSILRSVKLGLGNGMTLYDFLLLFETGQILSIIPFGEENLSYYLVRLRRDIDRCISALGLDAT